jgi:sn-glycerol 3-phosphate transport system substrate-binding protein
MRHLKLLLVALGVVVGLTGHSLWAAPVEIQWWHAMSGPLGDRVNDIANKFNASQDKYKVIPTLKGTYYENLTQAIAAYRAGKAPQLVQVFEVGTQTMMLSGAVVGVQDLMAEQGYKIDWNGFVAPVLGYYETADGKLMSMPFNSSTPIFYYNKDHFKKAGITKAPTTWDEVDADLTKLKASGQACGITTAWPSWIQIENYSALHNIPFATEANGFKGLDAVLEINNPKVVKHITRWATWIKDGKATYEGRTSQGADAAFVSQKCSMMTDSSGSYAALALAKFQWSAAPLPVEKGSKPLNSIIGGATLWVMKGASKEEYAGVAAFLNYLAGVDNQVWWHEQTGYVPITLAAFKEVKKSGFYKDRPFMEVGFNQLTRAKPTEISRGLRLGNFTQIRIAIEDELENIFGGKKTPEQGMADAVRRGNELLRQFEQANKS